MDNQIKEKIYIIREKLKKFPRVKLSNLSTPIEFLSNTSNELNLELYVKREDIAGPVFGGIYARALEYVFGEILSKGHDSVVQGGPSHSNQNRLVAAVCAKFGLKAHLVLRKKLPIDKENIGNLFLNQLYGADVKWVSAELGPELDAEKEKRYQEILADGKENPYLFRRDHVIKLNCLGILDFFLDLYEQLHQNNCMAGIIYLCGCGPTQSGMILGTRLVDPNIKIVGARPLHWDANEIIANEVNKTAQLLDLELRITKEDVINYAEYVGEDYGIPTLKGNEAIHYFAQKEGLIFDPIYTGKMAACFLDHARSGKIPNGTRVLLEHTGGTPLTLLYSKNIYSSLNLDLDLPSFSRE